MSPEAFSWWLHGWAEINGGKAPDATQWQIINDHLNLVFDKVTPDRYVGPTTSAQNDSSEGTRICACSPGRTDLPYFKIHSGDNGPINFIGTSISC